MNESEIKEIFKEKGALQTGHFILNSGLHSEQYIQCARVLQHPDLARRLGANLAEKFSHREVDVVIGPAVGGITLSFAVGLALDCRAIFTEKSEEGMKLRRSFDIYSDEKILVVDDVFTTGNSIKEVMKTIQAQGGKTIGGGVLVDRSKDKTEEFEVPIKSLIDLNLKTYSPKKCPMCRDGDPGIQPGST